MIVREAFKARDWTSLILISFFVLFGAVSAAHAAPKAVVASSPTSVSSGEVIVYPSLTSTGANPNGVALTLSNSNIRQYFYIRSAGTLAGTAITIAVSYSVPPAQTTFLHCDQGVLFIASGTCASGSPTTVAINGVITLNLTPGSWYEFEIGQRNRTTPTVSVSISTSQIRAALNTNS